MKKLITLPVVLVVTLLLYFMSFFIHSAWDVSAQIPPVPPITNNPKFSVNQQVVVKSTGMRGDVSGFTRQTPAQYWVYLYAVKETFLYPEDDLAEPLTPCDKCLHPDCIYADGCIYDNGYVSTGTAPPYISAPVQNGSECTLDLQSGEAVCHLHFGPMPDTVLKRWSSETPAKKLIRRPIKP